MTYIALSLNLINLNTMSNMIKKWTLHILNRIVAALTLMILLLAGCSPSNMDKEVPSKNSPGEVTPGQMITFDGIWDVVYAVRIPIGPLPEEVETIFDFTGLNLDAPGDDIIYYNNETFLAGGAVYDSETMVLGWPCGPQYKVVALTETFMRLDRCYVEDGEVFALQLTLHPREEVSDVE